MGPGALAKADARHTGLRRTARTLLWDVFQRVHVGIGYIPGPYRCPRRPCQESVLGYKRLCEV